jgi:hypothetical protein
MAISVSEASQQVVSSMRTTASNIREHCASRVLNLHVSVSQNIIPLGHVLQQEGADLVAQRQFCSHQVAL